MNSIATQSILDAKPLGPGEIDRECSHEALLSNLLLLVLDNDHKTERLSPLIDILTTGSRRSAEGDLADAAGQVTWLESGQPNPSFSIDVLSSCAARRVSLWADPDD